MMRCAPYILVLFLGGVVGSVAVDEDNFGSVTNQKAAVKEMFYHAYNGYLNHAFPKDELKPMSCAGGDTLGGYTLTLFDALDTLAVLQNKTEFARVVNWIGENVDFDKDKTVSVFETNIRVLGSLISGHMLASDPELDLMPEYSGGILLVKAKDLGTRLLKAFNSATGLPYGSVNLRHGVNKGETPVSATATAGTILLEFGLLSYLTGDKSFQKAAHRATLELWKRRSPLGLLGSHIDVETGQWVYFESGVSGGVDSFFEYMFKAYLLFGDKEYLDIFEEGYDAIIHRVKRGPFYPDVHMANGQIMFPYYRSLQSFWPGLQTIYGDLTLAEETFEAMHTVWTSYGFVPEALSLQNMKPVKDLKQYPLRPELAESAFYLYRATGNPKYRKAGENIVFSLNKWARVKCGYAAVEDVETKALRNHMDSYFLAETVKYLYLLFDDDPATEIFRNSTRYIFNTEAHLLPLPYPPAEEFLLSPTRLPDDTQRVARRKQREVANKPKPPSKAGWKKKKL